MKNVMYAVPLMGAWGMVLAAESTNKVSLSHMPVEPMFLALKLIEASAPLP